jgi:hypothetical protein
LAAVVHGKHPMRGYPVTWHLTPVPGGPGTPVSFLVERADGDLEDEAWRYALKDTEILSTERARELVQRLTQDR